MNDNKALALARLYLMADNTNLRKIARVLCFIKLLHFY